MSYPPNSTVTPPSTVSTITYPSVPPDTTPLPAAGGGSTDLVVPGLLLVGFGVAAVIAARLRKRQEPRPSFEDRGSGGLDG